MKLGDFQEMRYKKRMAKFEAAEGEIPWFLVPSVGQAAMTLAPTFPKMQPVAPFC